MRIAFDAKRAFHNRTGLGNYSRTLLNAFARYYPGHEYLLCNPRPSPMYEPQPPLIEKLPSRRIDRLFPAIWRSKTVVRDLKQWNVDLYHGLSHEIPAGLPGSGIRSVVTIHDLIHERYPGQYRALDVRIYRKKFRYACLHADRILATSYQTKQDIIDFYKTDPDKIAVCYQSCDPLFEEVVNHNDKEMVRQHYQLPPRYLLYVGSIIERKNLLGICKALFLLREEMQLPLVVIGDGGSYKEVVKAYLLQNDLQKRVIFLNETAAGRGGRFQAAFDLPAIYQMSAAFIYPSTFEGFGIPLLEAMWSYSPVITTRLSSLPEVAGDAALYVDPVSAQDMAEAIRRLVTDEAYAQSLRMFGRQRAQLFSTDRTAAAVMEQYEKG